MLGVYLVTKDKPNNSFFPPSNVTTSIQSATNTPVPSMTSLDKAKFTSSFNRTARYHRHALIGYRSVSSALTQPTTSPDKSTSTTLSVSGIQTKVQSGTSLSPTLTSPTPASSVSSGSSATSSRHPYLGGDNQMHDTKSDPPGYELFWTNGDAVLIVTGILFVIVGSCIYWFVFRDAKLLKRTRVPST